ncbi:O-antigen ligase family protein [Microvirga tunisiensis]|uniref:O-antigen ligase family protein n=1 Tax=Microvirga tunisiensis TaxID=2108360 RepID=A0A5N7MNV1_9HYPH|nr:O-antigen ligase family protein [Microvirga tunisiensis]MPR10554.1 hypothetical protein [Microvirga tunisiensis]MPR28711.1 hypothetical protein [Microvirga tunisiensis]
MIEPIGIATIVLGLVCILLGPRATIATLVVTTLFGSSAALFIGAANIQPAHFFLGFVAASALTRSREITAAIRAVSPPMPGFWLACLLIYGAVSAYVLPRILAGSTLIFPIGTSEYSGSGLVPLGPVSGNITQTVYLSADLASFALVVAVASTRAGFEAITGGVIAYAIGNILFALLDLGTYLTGTQDLLSFMRNARYTLHHNEEVSGLKRIAGSFTEASSFAGSTVVALSFTGTMWLCGRRPAWTGILALVSLILVILSTSSTGLLAVPFVMMILYATALYRSGLHPSGHVSAAVVLLAPLIVIIAALVVLLNDHLTAVIRDYVDLLVLSKSTSQSGIERASWNAAALQNFFDSWWFGVGLGTTRTSSFALAVLSHVGLPGAILLMIFIISAFARQRGRPRTFPSDVRLAARNSCLCSLPAAVASASTLDLGLLFFIMAGLACAEPERDAAEWPGGARVRNTGAQI